MRAQLIVVLALAGGFAAGFLVGRGTGGPASGSVEDARAALAELTAYRGQGAPALRKAIEWVDRIAAGGEALLPAIDSALRTAPEVRYTAMGGSYSFDPRTGVASALPTLRCALLEAASRIGGEQAEEILVRESTAARDWKERALAVLFLARRADRPQVRAFLTGHVRRLLSERKDDPEMVLVLRYTRGRVDPGVFDGFVRAIRAGWSIRGAAYEMAESLVAIDAGRAGNVLLTILADDQPGIGAKAVAALSLARLPEFRTRAANEILRQKNRTVLAAWFEGLKRGPCGEADRERDARESGDPARLRSFIEEHLAELHLEERLVREIGAKLGPEESETMEIERHLLELGKKVQVAEQELRGLE